MKKFASILYKVAFGVLLVGAAMPEFIVAGLFGFAVLAGAGTVCEESMKGGHSMQAEE